MFNFPASGSIGSGVWRDYRHHAANSGGVDTGRHCGAAVRISPRLILAVFDGGYFFADFAPPPGEMPSAGTFAGGGGMAVIRFQV